MNTSRSIILTLFTIVAFLAPSLAYAQEATPAAIECATLEECQEIIKNLQEENTQLKTFIEENGLTEAFEAAIAAPQKEVSVDTDPLGGYDPLPVTKDQLYDFFETAACDSQTDMEDYVLRKLTANEKVQVEDLYEIVGNKPAYNDDYDIIITYNQYREHYIIASTSKYGTSKESYNGLFTIASMTEGLDYDNGITPCSPTYWLHYTGGK